MGFNAALRGPRFARAVIRLVIRLQVSVGLFCILLLIPGTTLRVVVRRCAGTCFIGLELPHRPRPSPLPPLLRIRGGRCVGRCVLLDNARVPAAHDPAHVVQDCTHWERVDVQRAIRFNISARKVRQSCDALGCSEAANAVLT